MQSIIEDFELSADKIAVVTPDQEVSHAKFLAYVRHLVRFFDDNQISTNHRVAIYLEPNLKSIVLIAALFVKGITFVVLNTKLKREVLLEQLEIVKPDFCFVSQKSEYFSSYRQVELEDIDLQEDDYDFQAENNNNREAVILLTTGSSQQKAVVLSRKNILASVSAVKTEFRFEQGDFWLLSLPIYHIAGLSIVFRFLLSAMGLCLPRLINTKEIITSLKKNSVSHISLTPSSLVELELRNLLKNLKLALIGGAKLPISLKDHLIDLPVVISYGMTELASTAAVIPIKDYQEHRVGKILSHLECKVENSKVYFQGESVFQQYLGSSKQSAWFETGDLGEIKEGFLYIYGRVDRMIISGGENIYPEEIENLALKHDQVQAAAVIKVVDKKWGERPVLFYTGNKQVDLDSYFERCLTEYQKPKDVIYLESLPHISGKVNYQYLEEYYDETFKAGN